MWKFKRDEGLTLIELLITIAVLAIVAAIALPVVSNVVNSSEDSAVTQTQSDIEDFTGKYDNVGKFDVAVDSTADTVTFTGYVDLNGDSAATSDEAIEELVIDSSRFAITDDGVAVADLTGSYDADDASVWAVTEAN